MDIKSSGFTLTYMQLFMLLPWTVLTHKIWNMFMHDESMSLKTPAYFTDIDVLKYPETHV